MKEKYYSDTFYQLKNINPLELDSYLEDIIILSKEEAIELTYIYIKKLIKEIKASKKEKDRWLKLNDEYRKAFLSIPRIHLFKTNTGSGKTVTSVMWIKFLTKLSSKIEGFVVLSPEYEHGTEEVEKIIKKFGQHYKHNEDYVKIEGQKRLCKELKTQINDVGVTIGDLLGNGISITEFCENECSIYNVCNYIGNRKTILASKDKGGIKNWIGVHRQISYIIPIFLINVGDILVIIDENFTNAIKEHYEYNVPLLRNNVEFLTEMLKELKSDVDKNYRYFLEDFKKLLEIFMQTIYKVKQPDYELINDILDNINTTKGTDNAYIEMLNEQAYKLIKKGGIKPFKFIFSEICNYIDNYSNFLRSYKEEGNYEEVYNWLKACFYRKKFQISFLYYDKYKLGLIMGKDNLIKLIINDATANKYTLEYLLEDKEPVVEHIEEWEYENAEYHQLKKRVNYNPRKEDIGKNKEYAYYPKSSFLFKKTFFYLINNLKVILEKHKDEQVLVVAREIGKKKNELNKLKHINGGIKLSDYILSNAVNKYDNVLFDDYPLSGTNKYSDINVIVILGRPELPKAVINRESTLIRKDPEKFRNEFSRSSIIQAIGRIMRGNNHKYVYLLTGFSLEPDLKLKKPIKTYKSHTDFQNSLLAEIKITNKKKEKENKINVLLKYIKKNKFITSKKYAEIHSFSPEYARKKLNQLVKKGFIKFRRVEKGKKRFYV